MYFALLCRQWILLDAHGWLQGKRIDLNKQIRGLEEGATGSTAFGRGRASGPAQDGSG